MENKVNQLLKVKTVPAVTSILLGIVIIAARRAALDLLVRIVGALVIAGGIGLIAVCVKKSRREGLELKMTLPVAFAVILAGILLIVFARLIVDLFPTLIGIYLILNGLSHLTAAYANPEDRIAVSVMGAMVLVLGLMIVCRPGFLVNMILVFIGGAMIVNGVMDLLVLKRVQGGLW